MNKRQFTTKELLKSRIDRTVLKSNYLYALAKAFRSRKDKEFLSAIRDSNSLVHFRCKNGNYGIPPVCVFNGFPKTGMFAYLRSVADFLFFCDCMGFEAYIRWSDSICYDASIIDIDNPFEYFFVQPSGLTSDSLASRVVVDYAPGIIMKARECTEGSSYNPGYAYIDELASIVSAHLQFNPPTSVVLRQFIEKYDINEHTLGVHIRGTDFKNNYKWHPVYVAPEQYYPTIDRAFENHHFDKMFLATDDSEILGSFLSHYGSELVVYEKETLRDDGKLGIHVMAQSNKSLSPYREALNALCDMIGLSYCGGFVSGLSNVAMFARIYNRSRNSRYIFDEIVNNEVNLKSHSPKRRSVSDRK